MADDEEIILADLDDDELVQQMHDDLYDGLQDEIVEGVKILLDRKWTPYDVLTKALVEGMTIVGIDFRDGILFVPEVLMAANAMKAGMVILRPLLAETGAPRVGSMVIGTVKGDIHDIGKNLVSMMLEGAGFDVIDLGINNPVENYLDALEEHKPDILGMSALLTTTMPYICARAKFVDLVFVFFSTSPVIVFQRQKTKLWVLAPPVKKCFFFQVTV